MPANTKITLSPQELQLVDHSEWILTKRAIIEKAVQILAGSAEKMRAIVGEQKSWLPEKVVLCEPKISKGENYRQLPYVLLDMPRCFDNGNIFAVRTMFWWGNFFSCTLHIAGSYKTIFEEALQRNVGMLLQDEYYICINDDQWQHHFEPDNYVEVKTRTAEEIKIIIREQPFIKIAMKFSLMQWNEMPGLLEHCFSEMIQLVKT